MKLKLKKSHKIAIITSVIIGALSVPFYIFLWPYISLALKASKEVSDNEKQLTQLKKDFDNLAQPQKKIESLEKEVASLKDALKGYDKLNTPMKGSIPEEVSNPIPELERSLIENFCDKKVEEVLEKNKAKFTAKGISLPSSLNIPLSPETREEAISLLNGLSACEDLLDVIYNSNVLKVNKFAFLEPYDQGGIIQVMPFVVGLTLEPESVITFLYNLQSSPQFYFVTDFQLAKSEDDLEEIKVAKRSKAKASVKGEKKEGGGGGGLLGGGAKGAKEAQKSSERTKKKTSKKKASSEGSGSKLERMKAAKGALTSKKSSASTKSSKSSKSSQSSAKGTKAVASASDSGEKLYLLAMVNTTQVKDTEVGKVLEQKVKEEAIKKQVKEAMGDSKSQGEVFLPVQQSKAAKKVKDEAEGKEVKVQKKSFWKRTSHGLKKFLKKIGI